MNYDCQYENTRRVSYGCGEDGSAVFVPVCKECHRYVKAPKTIILNYAGDLLRVDVWCSRCGTTEMHFEGFM